MRMNVARARACVYEIERTTKTRDKRVRERERMREKLKNRERERERERKRETLRTALDIVLQLRCAIVHSSEWERARETFAIQEGGDGRGMKRNQVPGRKRLVFAFSDCTPAIPLILRLTEVWLTACDFAMWFCRDPLQETLHPFCFARFLKCSRQWEIVWKFI